MQYPTKAARISEHGLIGNLRTAALVSTRGSIDFMCSPDFDSPTVFGELLEPEAGHFRISPEHELLAVKQLYLTDTAILVTRFYTAAGVSELMDFMVAEPESGGLQLIRRLKQVSGRGSYRLSLQPRFGYGTVGHRLDHAGPSCRFSAPDAALWLYSPVPLQPLEGDVNAIWRLEEGAACWFLLTDQDHGEMSPAALAAFGGRAYERMYQWWTSWAAQGSYRGRWKEMINRSAITLKLLSYGPEGSFVAAPTFALPEDPGGERNWDYRFTWIRDASLTVNAFIRLGYRQEADAFIHWLMRHALPGPLRLMYTIRGGEVPPERNLEHWRGYDDSQPVRVGNNACWQTQLDIYGELLDTIALYLSHGGGLPAGFWELLLPHIDHICRIWQEPDHGIWEVRGGRRHFLHSRLMCWVALDRALEIGARAGLPHPEAEWSSLRTAIRGSIEEHFWDAGKQSFVQYQGTDELDAALLLMPLSGFIAPDDPRWISTLAAIERELKLDVMVYRYRAGETDTDGLRGSEGTFTLCSFWYISCLAHMGAGRGANEHFARLIRYGNQLGLFSEQIGPDGSHLGNFPQAFTHLALIETAIALNASFEREGGIG